MMRENAETEPVPFAGRKKRRGDQFPVYGRNAGARVFNDDPHRVLSRNDVMAMRFSSCTVNGLQEFSAGEEHLLNFSGLP
jgi:hypothetical protein